MAVHQNSSNNCKQLLHKRKLESTGGLLKVITVAVNHQYGIINNIAVQDGIMNGAECCIKYIQPQAHDSTFPATVWVQFEDSRVGKLQWQKYSYLQNTHILPRLDPNICPEKIISH